MHPISWVNQFEMKDTCIGFVINNVSPQFNLILNSKVEKICRDCSPNFLWNKWQLWRKLHRGSEYVSDYPEALSIIVNWRFTLNVSWMFLIWFVFYLTIYSRSFPVRFNKVMFETCQNFTLKNKKGFYLVAISSFW